MKIDVRIALFLSLFVLMVPTVQAELVGHWTFDEGTGSTAWDSSGNGYEGVFTGGATYTTGAVGSGALQLNGTDAYVSVPYQAELALADSDFTIAFWSNWAGVNAQPYQMPVAMEWGADYSGGYFAAYLGADALEFGHVGGSRETNAPWDISTDNYNTSLSTGTWDHLALVYNKTAQTRDFYVNGVLKESVATANPLADHGSGPLCFGVYPIYSDPAWYGGFFNGALDDVQIYNQALSASEVATVAAGGIVIPPGAGIEGLSRGHNILLEKGLQLRASARIKTVIEDNNPDQWDTWDESLFTTLHIWGNPSTALSHMPAASGILWSNTKAAMVTDLESSELPYASTLVSFQFSDEQSITDPGEQAILKTSMAAFHKNQPNVITYTNQWGSQVSSSALATYMREVQPDMLCFDTYPFNGDVVGGSPKVFYEHLEKYRELGLAGNDGTGAKPIPVAVYTQTCVTPYIVNNHLVSESEIRLNTFSAWAFGCKMTDGFIYATDSLEPNTAAMFYGIGTSSRTPQFAMIAETNRQSLNLGPALVRLISTDVRMAMGQYKSNLLDVDNDLPSDVLAWDSNADPYITGITATNQGGKNDGLEGDVIVGYFKPLHESFTSEGHEDDIYFMIVNGLSDKTGSAADCNQLIHLDFDFGTSGIDSLLRMSRETGLVEKVSLLHNGGSLYSLDLYLDGGTGDLFKFNNDTDFLNIPLSTLPGDANSDGKVDGSDVTILAGNWQVMSGATWAMGDFNSDGKVDGSDVTILAGNWQAGVTAAADAVPEPGTLVLLLGGVWGMLACWRRRSSVNL